MAWARRSRWVRLIFRPCLAALLILVGAISVIRSFFVNGTPIGGFALKPLAFVVASVILFGAHRSRRRLGDRTAVAGDDQRARQRPIPLGT